MVDMPGTETPFPAWTKVLAWLRVDQDSLLGYPTQKDHLVISWAGQRPDDREGRDHWEGEGGCVLKDWEGLAEGQVDSAGQKLEVSACHIL